MTERTEDNVVGDVIVENGDGAIYVMENTTSSNGAISGAKSYFADAHGHEYRDVSGSLFTGGVFGLDKTYVGVVKND